MKDNILRIRRYLPWFLLLMGMDVFSIILLWLSNAKALHRLSATIVLFSLLFFTVVLLVVGYQDKKRKQVFQSFLNTPDAWHEEELVKTVSAWEEESVRRLGDLLREKNLALQNARAELGDYEEYVEAWAHETKTPLSLLLMILENRQDEMSEQVYKKLNYVWNYMQENISKMLYYARLKSTNKDYLFEVVDLGECLNEVLEEYKPLLEEKGFQIKNTIVSRTVFTDRRGLTFLFSQIISNAIKYSSNTPEVNIFLEQMETEDILHIRDNGIGVHGCDLPYIFEKGFTGDSGDSRKKATGMGLYLSKKIADDLNLCLEAFSELGQGFEIIISFPRIAN